MVIHFRRPPGQLGPFNNPEPPVDPGQIRDEALEEIELEIWGDPELLLDAMIDNPGSITPTLAFAQLASAAHARYRGLRAAGEAADAGVDTPLAFEVLHILKRCVSDYAIELYLSR